MEQIQSLERFQKDGEQFHENVNKLREKGFTGKFVAIKNSKPIVSGENVEIVVKDIEKRGDDPSFVFIEFVHPEGYTLIL